jgi:AraC-like DNA-binding protein
MDLMSKAMETLRLHSVHFRWHELGPDAPALFERHAAVHWLERGAATCEAGEVQTRLSAGDWLLVPRPLALRLEARGRPAARILSGELAFGAPDHPLLAALPGSIHVSHAQLSTNPHFCQHVASLCAELTQPREGSRALVARLTEVLLIHAMRMAPPPARAECPSSGWLRGFQDPLLRPVLAAMHDAPGHAWTLARLAKLSGQSRSAFAAHFAAAMGEPAMGYLARWRMFRARSLLRESELPLVAIAEQVGYGSATAFSLAFTREHQVSPGAFRQAAHAPAAPAGVTYRSA